MFTQTTTGSSERRCCAWLLEGYSWLFLAPGGLLLLLPGGVLNAMAPGGLFINTEGLFPNAVAPGALLLLLEGMVPGELFQLLEGYS